MCSLKSISIHQSDSESLNNALWVLAREKKIPLKVNVKQLPHMKFPHVQLFIYMKNLALITERSKVFYGIFRVSPALYFRTTREELFRSTADLPQYKYYRRGFASSPYFRFWPVIQTGTEQEVKNCSPFTQKIWRLTTYICSIPLIWVISYNKNVLRCRVWKIEPFSQLEASATYLVEITPEIFNRNKS